MGLNRDILQEKYFIFDGTASTDYRLICSGAGTYGAPKRKYDTVSIPGRNGSLLIDKGYYNDTTVEFKDCGFIPEVTYPSTLELRLAGVREWLYSPIGYRRLECSWQPDEYRIGYVSNDFDPDMINNLEAGRVDLKFTCKPQRFLKSGENDIEVTSGMTLVNPTSFKACPLITVTGAGTLTIENSTGTFSIKTDRTATIDCDLMDSYSGASNLNSNTTFTLPNPEDKIFLDVGENVLSYSGFTKVVLEARWWRL